MPCSRGTTDADVVVLKLNDPSSPVHNLPTTDSLVGWEIEPENLFLSGTQPNYHDMMRKMYKGCHVRSSSIKVRATPGQFLLQGGAGVSLNDRTRTTSATASTSDNINAVAQPFRICITKDEDAYEDLCGSHREYKSRMQDARFTGVKTQRTHYRSAINNGHDGSYTKPITETYEFRRFWDLSKSVPSYVTKYHRALGPLRRTYADEASSGVDLQSAMTTSDQRMDWLARNRDLIKFTKPWNSYQGENPSVNNSGFMPKSPAFVRIQCLPTDRISTLSAAKNPFVKCEIVMKFDCIFFDPTELIEPLAVPNPDADADGFVDQSEQNDLDMGGSDNAADIAAGTGGAE